MAKTKRQTSIPGTEPKTIKEVSDAAEAYVEARDARQKKTEREVEAKEALVTVMKTHGLTVYTDADVDPPLVVTLSPGKDKVKVTEANENDEPGEDAAA
jgi:hypothetical protein